MKKLVDGKLLNVSSNETLERTAQISSDAKAEAGTAWLHNRQAAYAQLNQDEMRYDDQLNGTTTWFDTIAAIKAKYPKPVGAAV